MSLMLLFQFFLLHSRLYDITSCDASCDYGNVPLHYPKLKLKLKEKKEKSN